MTDFVSIRRSLDSEKERLEKLKINLTEKLTNTKKEIDSALAFLEKTEQNFSKLENDLNDRKREEIALQNEKKELLNNIESLKENIQRIELSIKDENEKINKLEQELNQLENELNTTNSEITKSEGAITVLKESITKKTSDLSSTRTRMETNIQEAQNTLDDLTKQEQQDVQVSPVLDFLLKEVRIDIPEVEILSILAYRNQAMGMDELKQAVSKTPPVIILKAIRNLDSKGIIKYDERLDTIEITANLV